MLMIGSGTHWAAIITSGAAIVGALGLFLLLLQIVEGRRSRDAQITADLSRRWDESVLLEVRMQVNEFKDPALLRDEIVRLRGENAPKYYALLCEPNYFEDLAILCNQKALDKRMIRESFGEMLSRRYDRWSGAIDWLRDGDPGNYKNFQLLAEEMRTQPRSGPIRRFRRWLATAIAPYGDV